MSGNIMKRYVKHLFKEHIGGTLRGLNLCPFVRFLSSHTL